MASVEASREGRRRTRVQAYRRQASDHLWERIEGRLHGTAERRGNRSGAGRDMGSRSALTVPVKRGNRTEGPRGGKGSTGTRNRWRERSREHRFPIRS
jgi:hypothetical protein